MSQQLFSSVCLEVNKLITERYSTSFSLGIRMFSQELRGPIYSIYGFVRFADEIVDTFHDHDKKLLLSEFKNDTFKAIATGLSLNPVLHSFQEVVNKFGIDHELITAFLYSMEMDLIKVDYDQAELKTYIYGSAEVVGLMCLKVFVNGDQDEYERLKPFACTLGSAFQKINFLRDMKSDFLERGRVYFPDIDYHNFTEDDKRRLEDDIKSEFDYAYKGIVQLPKSARLGVYCAYKYYINLFYKIQSSPATVLTDRRIRVSDKRKLYLLTTSAFQNRFGFL
jgi:15-cis-phytoene synthase